MRPIAARTNAECSEARQTKLDRHVEGRIAYVDDRRLRYEAGWDICLATAGILREYVADCESSFFMCDHTEDLIEVKALLVEIEKLEHDGTEDLSELEVLRNWLHRVAGLLVRLWD